MQRSCSNHLFFCLNPEVVRAIQALAGLAVGKSLQEIVSNFRGFYRLLTSDGQMRWVRADAHKLHNMSDSRQINRLCGQKLPHTECHGK